MLILTEYKIKIKITIMAIIKIKYENSKIRLNHVLALIKEIELCFCLHDDLLPSHNQLISQEFQRMANFIYV